MLRTITKTGLLALIYLFSVTCYAQAPPGSQALLADAARQAAQQAMSDAGFDQQAINALALDPGFAPRGFSTKIASESAVNVFPGHSVEPAYTNLIIRWDSQAKNWVTLGEASWADDRLSLQDRAVVVGNSYSYASVLVDPWAGGYNYSPIFSVTLETESVPVAGTLRVAVILSTFADTLYEVTAADVEDEFGRIQSVYDELSYGQQVIEVTTFDTGRADLSQADTLELLQSLQIMNWLYYNSPGFEYGKPCDIDAIARQAQDILDLDEFPADFPFRFVTDITTIDVEGSRPYGCEQIGAGGVLAGHIGIPEQVNLQRYDLLVIHPYGDVPLGDSAFNNSIHYSDLEQGSGPVTVDLEYIFLSGSPFDALPLNYGQLSDFDSEGRTQDDSYTQGQPAQNLLSHVLAHEFGHALGIKTHANGVNTRMAQQEVNQLNQDPLPAIGLLGGKLEYGDYFDVMGTGDYSQGMNPWYREYLGWLSADRIQTIENSQAQIELSGLNSPTGTVAAKIPVNGGWIYASYRPASGYDESLKIPELIDNTRGVMLHYVKETGFPLKTAYLLDATGSIEDTVFVVLPGNEFSLYGVTIKNVSVNGNRLSLDVQFDGQPLPSFAMNAGLNDAWYNPATDGQGFFVTVYPEIELVFLSWFTYDTTPPPEGATANLGDPGLRWMTAVGTFTGDRAVLDVTFTSGGIFDTASEITRDSDGAGTIVLTFDDCESGKIDYEIPSIGRTGTVPIQRIVSDNVALCKALEMPPPAQTNSTPKNGSRDVAKLKALPGLVEMNAGLNDAWYNPATDGQGFFVTVYPEIELVFLSWFTYDTMLPPENASAHLGDPGQRWLTAAGNFSGNQVLMNITMTSGGIFDTASQIQRTDPAGSDGTIKLTFADCNSGSVEYDIPAINKTGTVPIQRIVNDNIALCETL